MSNRRPVRLTLAVTAGAAALVGLVGGSGVLAVFSDTAKTGNSGSPDDMEYVESGAIVATAVGDIQIARYPRDPACGTFQDDLDLPVYQQTGVEPGSTGVGGPLFRGLCVKNVGTDDVDVTMAAVDVSSVEVTCEPSEEAVDPQGSGCGDLGEADEHVSFRMTVVARTTDPDSCPINPVPGGAYQRLDEPAAAFSLEPGEIACLAIDLAYQPATPDAAAAAQTDRARWRWELGAEAA